MQSIRRQVNAKPLAGNSDNRQIFRVIGTTDINGAGTHHALADIDPVIFLDDASFQGEVPETFSKHPHLGLAANSYLIKGEFRAWDNIHGDARDLNRAGGVYYLEAGRGVVHGEAAAAGKRDARWLQMWINPGIHDHPRPQANYQLYQPDEIPVYEEAGLWVKVVIGEAYGRRSPLQVAQQLNFLHIRLAKGCAQSFPLGARGERRGFVYVLNGSGLFGDEQLAARGRECLELSATTQTLRVGNPSSEELEFILVDGTPHKRPVYKLLGHGGAFVADSVEGLQAALQQFEERGLEFGKCI